MSTSKKTTEILAFAGSLRKGSYNRGLLRASLEQAPSSVDIQIFDLEGIPLYNADTEAQGDPDGVTEFKVVIKNSDGLLIATPEYNHGLSAVTKNAIDWASRSPKNEIMDKKPVGILGASPSITGTARSQDQLRHSLKAINAYCMPKPEVLVYHAHKKFDDTGKLTDETTKKYLQKYLKELERWIKKFVS